MLAGRWPGWLLLLAAASSAGVVAVPSATAQTRPVSPATTPATVPRPAVEPTVRLARGCAPLPELAGQNVDEVLARLSPELFRPRVHPESSSQPRGTILRQPASELIKGRLCYLDIAVSDGSLTRVPRLRGATAEEAAQRLAAADLGISIREKASGERAGRVFEQKPAANEEVRRRSTVVAFIATPAGRTGPDASAAAAAAAVAKALEAATRDSPQRTPEPEPPEETCLPLPDLAGQHVDDVLPTLGRRYFRPRLSREPSSEPRGTILRQPTTEPIDGSLCYVDVAISDGSLTRVPELEGTTGEEAERRLAAADLRIAIREVPSSKPAGRVFDQKPRAGAEAPRQSTVAAIVAVPELFDVPGVIGLPYREAARQLDRFTVSRAVAASRLPSGQVIDQDPRPPARRPAGAEVRLEVSDGSLVLVPRVEREALEAARGKLGEAELRAEVEELEDDLAPGVVATQDPAAGTEVARGSSVRLVVSTGLPVPDVVGQQVADAAALLGRFEVRQSTVHSREPQGQVIDQEPRPRVRVAAGTVVRVDLSDGSLVVVPPLEQQALDSARTELASLDLQAEVEELEGDLAPGEVATQEPAAGTEVSRGSSIRLVVSSGLSVPDVVGRQLADAEAVLARFSVEQSAVGSAEPPGQVIDQVPRAPARAAAGSRVALVVSDGSQAVPPRVGGGPATPAAPDGFTWPRWLTYLTVLLAGAGVFQAVRLRLRPPPPEAQVAARVESDLGSVEITDVGLAGPEIRVSARLDSGDCDIRLEGEST